MADPIISPDGKSVWTGSGWEELPQTDGQSVNVKDSVIGGDLISTTSVDADVVKAAMEGVVASIKELNQQEQQTDSVKSKSENDLKVGNLKSSKTPFVSLLIIVLIIVAGGLAELRWDLISITDKTSGDNEIDSASLETTTNETTSNIFIAEDAPASLDGGNEYDDLALISFSASYAEDDLEWSSLEIVLEVAAGYEDGTNNYNDAQPYICTNKGTSPCDIWEEKPDGMWNSDETIALQENGHQICQPGQNNANTCDVYIYVTYNGNVLEGTEGIIRLW